VEFEAFLPVRIHLGDWWTAKRLRSTISSRNLAIGRRKSSQFSDADDLFGDNGQRATKYIAEIPVRRYKTLTAYLKQALRQWN